MDISVVLTVLAVLAFLAVAKYILTGIGLLWVIFFGGWH